MVELYPGFGYEYGFCWQEGTTEGGLLVEVIDEKFGILFTSVLTIGCTISNPPLFVESTTEKFGEFSPNRYLCRDIKYEILHINNIVKNGKRQQIHKGQLFPQKSFKNLPKHPFDYFNFPQLKMIFFEDVTGFKLLKS